MSKQSRYISQKVKDEVRKRDRNRCVKCGDKSYLEFDHITPHSKGAPNTAENIQLLCRKCNLNKGNKTSHCSCGSWIPAGAKFCQACGKVQLQARSFSNRLVRAALLVLALIMIYYGLKG